MSAIKLLPVKNTLASLAIDGPASSTWNTIVEAWVDGVAGNSVTLAAVADGSWIPNVGTFTISTNPTNSKATGVLTFAGNATRANAFGTLTFGANPLDTETVTIDARVYTFQTVLTNADGNVLIGATASDSLDNLIAAITLGAGSGTTYAAATTLHATVTAAVGAGDTMVATAKTSGTGGNSIATTTIVTLGSWGGATLASGATAETVTLDARVYTFVNFLTAANQVAIGANAAATIVNLVAAISAGAGSGTAYGAGTVAHATVTAADGAGDTIDVTAVSRGTAGNSIVSTETMASGSFGAATLAGGTLETVTIGSAVYTWKHSDNITTAFDVLIDSTASLSCDKLIAAINLNGVAGTDYGTGTTEHTQVRAYVGAGDTVVVHSRPTILTAVGTLIATTETCAACAWGAATLADGTDGTNVTFGVSGTAVTAHFASGYSTVEDFEAALAADAAAFAVMRTKTAGTTPLYLLVVTDDDFSATAFTGGGATSSSAPTLSDSAAGVAMPHTTNEALILVRNVDAATGTTKTATVTLWGFSPITERWYVIGTLNDGSAIAETSSDAINYAELVTGLRRFSRLYAHLSAALGGTGTEVEIYADCVPASAVSA